MNNWNARFKQRLDHLKRTEGMTQTALADTLDISQGTIGHWLNARSEPRSLEDFESLAKALGVSLNWLLYGSEKGPSPEVESRGIPVIEQNQATDFMRGRSVTAIEYIHAEPLEKKGGTLYAILLSDRGMSPRFLPGDYVVISVDKNPKVDDVIAVEFDNDGSICIGTYFKSGPKESIEMSKDSFPLPSDWRETMFRGTVIGGILSIS